MRKSAIILIVIVSALGKNLGPIENDFSELKFLTHLDWVRSNHPNIKICIETNGFRKMLGLFDRDVLNKVEKPSNGESGFLALGYDAGLGDGDKKTAAEVGGVVIERKCWATASKIEVREKYGEVVKPLPIEVSPFSLWLTMGKVLKERFLKEMEEVFNDFRENIYVDPDTSKNQTFWITFSQPELYWYTLKRFPQAIGKQNGEYYILGTEIIKMKMTINTFHDKLLDKKRMIVTYCKNINTNPAFEKLRKFIRDRNTARKNNWVKIFAGKKDQCEMVPELDLDAKEFRVSENWLGEKADAELYKSIWAQSDSDYLNNLNIKRVGYNPRKITPDIKNYLMSENMRVAKDTEKYRENLNKWASNKSDPIKHLEPEYVGSDAKIRRHLAAAKLREAQNKDPFMIPSLPQKSAQNPAEIVPITSSPSKTDKNNEYFSFDIESNLNETETESMFQDLPPKLKNWQEVISSLTPSTGDHVNPVKVMKLMYEDKDFQFEDMLLADFNFLMNVFCDTTATLDKDEGQKIYSIGNEIFEKVKYASYAIFEEAILKFFKQARNLNDLKKLKSEIEEYLEKENVAKLEKLKEVIKKMVDEDEKDAIKINAIRSEINLLLVPATSTLLKADLLEQLNTLTGLEPLTTFPNVLRKKKRSRSYSPENSDNSCGNKNQKLVVEDQDGNNTVKRRQSFTNAKERMKSTK